LSGKAVWRADVAVKFPDGISLLRGVYTGSL